MEVGQEAMKAVAVMEAAMAVVKAVALKVVVMEAAMAVVKAVAKKGD